MKIKAAVLNTMSVKPPYAQSKPLSIKEIDLDPPGPTLSTKHRRPSTIWSPVVTPAALYYFPDQEDRKSISLLREVRS